MVAIHSVASTGGTKDTLVALDAGLRDVPSGAGLGLATSDGLARLMGAEISIDSRFGVGTTVTVSFVAAALCDPDDAQLAALSATSSA